MTQKEYESYLEILINLTKEKLDQEYKDYYGGYLFLLSNLETYAPSVRYPEIQSKVMDVIKVNQEIAKQLDEYYDSDYDLINDLIERIIEGIAA